MSQFNRLGTSISRWCSSGCCPIPEPPPCGTQREQPSFLLVTQDMPFTVEAGEAIPFCGPAIVDGDCFLCEEEYLQFFSEREEERHEGRSWRRRRTGKCKCNCGGGGCDKSSCPEFELCCLPIIDEVTPSPGLCMCGCCETQPDRSECYHFEYGNIFVASGVYLIEYSIQIPEGLMEFINEVHLVANGEIIPGSHRSFRYDGTALTVLVRVIYEASEPTQISLVAPNGLTIPNGAEGELLVSMTINGIC